MSKTAKCGKENEQLSLNQLNAARGKSDVITLGLDEDFMHGIPSSVEITVPKGFHNNKPKDDVTISFMVKKGMVVIKYSKAKKEVTKQLKKLTGKIDENKFEIREGDSGEALETLSVYSSYEVVTTEEASKKRSKHSKVRNNLNQIKKARNNKMKEAIENPIQEDDGEYEESKIIH